MNINGRSQGGGRSANRLADVVRRMIRAGECVPGQFLPSLRRLAEENGVAYMTAVRALKLLEEEGLITAEPRQGYRVMMHAGKSSPGAPIAVIVGGDLADTELWSPTHRGLLMAFQIAAGRRGYSTLGLVLGDKTAEQVVDQIQASKVIGVALDATNADVIGRLKRLGIPTVLVDAWTEDAGVDGVVQDNYRGSFLAAQHLIAKKCTRISWIGTTFQSIHALERYGGAVSALAIENLSLHSRHFSTGDTTADMLGPARELLTQPELPDGIIAMWQGATHAIRETADDLGLVIGRDFQMIGWCIEENYENGYLPPFHGKAIPPAVMWSVRAMAETAVNRLMARRANPVLPGMRTNVPVRLRIAEA